MVYFLYPHMQTQAATTGTDDRHLRGANPEMPVMQAEQTPARTVEDISGLEADEKAIAEARKANRVEELQTKSADGKILTTLRVAPEPIPQEAKLEQDPVHKIKKEVEAIMQEGLVEVDKKTNELKGVYTQLQPDRQEKLKAEGERLASEFDEMIRTGKFDPQQIQVDMKEWLKIIPGVNQPWTEQEATLKKDKISNLYNQIRRDPTSLN